MEGISALKVTIALFLTISTFSLFPVLVSGTKHKAHELELELFWLFHKWCSDHEFYKGLCYHDDHHYHHHDLGLHHLHHHGHHDHHHHHDDHHHGHGHGHDDHHHHHHGEYHDDHHHQPHGHYYHHDLERGDHYFKHECIHPFKELIWKLGLFTPKLEKWWKKAELKREFLCYHFKEKLYPHSYVLYALVNKIKFSLWKLLA